MSGIRWRFVCLFLFFSAGPSIPAGPDLVGLAGICLRASYYAKWEETYSWKQKQLKPLQHKAYKMT